MRITRESLLRIARETAAQRAHAHPDLVAIYLTGALLTENPLLGGAADIDLVCVHSGPVDQKREVVPLSPEIHLDIKHTPQSEYDQPRELRFHPWLGPEMYDPMLLHQQGHFFEYVQAAVRDKYHDQESAGRRARLNQSHGRQIWEELRQTGASRPDYLLKYLKCINHAANAVAVLTGPVLAERRTLMQFPARAQAVNRSELSGQLLKLVGQANGTAASLSGMLAGWEQSFRAAGSRPGADARLHPARQGYYRMAMDALLASAEPHMILWPLLHSWTLAAASLPVDEQDLWLATCRQLGLIDDAIPIKLSELDAFLDGVDELLNDLGAPES